MPEENDPPAAPLDPATPVPVAVPVEPEPCANCVALIAERDKLAATLAEALASTKTARAERDEAVRNLNKLVKAVKAGKDKPEPEPTSGPAPQPDPVPAAAVILSPGMLDSIIYFPGRVPGEKYDAYYAAKAKA